MKKVLLFLVLVLGCAMCVFAQQENEKISYQAVVRDSENHLVYNTDLTVTVSIANSVGGPAVFTEHHAVRSNANGLISLLIGDGTRLSGRWEDIRWNGAVVTATIRRASTQEVLAVHELPLQAVPYALYADYADSTDLNPVFNEITETAGQIRNELADTAGAIRNALNTTAGQIRNDLADTAAAIRNAMPVVNDGILTIKQGETLLGTFTANQSVDAIITIPTPAQQVQSDWTEDNDQAPSYIQHKPDLDQYVTNAHLNDTLGHYYNAPTVDNTLSQYATNAHLNDTLKDYLTIDGLCDSLQNCDVITNLQTADSLLGARIASDSIVLSGKIRSDSAYLKGLIDSNSASITNNTTNITNNTTNISNITNNITSLQVADSVLSARFARDSIALSKRLDTMFTHICDSLEQCEVIANLQNADAALSARITADSILSYRADSILAARISRDSILSSRADSVLSARITADSTNLANNYYNRSKINDTVRYILSQIDNTSGDLNDNYYTKPEINDTLSHYITTDGIDSLLGNYAKKDTLENYLTIAGLCDSIKNCEVITNLQNTDSILAARITRDSILSYRTDSILAARITRDSVLSYRADSILATRITRDSILSYKADSILLARLIDTAGQLRLALKDSLGRYLDSTQVRKEIHDTADVLRNAINATNTDLVALKNRVNTFNTNVCDTVMNCEGIQTMQTNIATNATNIQTNATNIANLHKVDSALAAHILNDSILSYQADSALFVHIINDSIVSYQSDSALAARITADSANLADHYYNKIKINDTLSHYTTNDAIDSLLGNYATKDTLENYLTIAGLCDSIKKCEVITNLQNVDSILAARITRDSLLSCRTDSILAARIKADSILSYKSDSILSARITHDSILSYKADSVLAARITADSILSYRADSALSVRIINDSVLFYRTDSVLLAHILNDCVLSHQADSILLARIVNDSVISYRTDSILLAHILNDSIVSHQSDSVLLARIMADSTNLADNYYNKTVIDQILNDYVKEEELENYLTIDGLCDSVKKCGVITNLQNADSALSARIISDSVLFYKTDSVLLAHILNDSVLSHQADSILLARILSDSANLADHYYTKAKINDTLSHYTTTDQIDSLLREYATKDTLENYLTIAGLCDSIKKCDVITNLQNVDSILAARITRDSLLSYRTDSILAARIKADSILSYKADSVLAARITADSILSYKSDSILSARITHDSTLSYKADSVLAARIKADSTNLADNYYNKIKINDTVAYILSQINTTSGSLSEDYYTKDEINDTLSHYTTTDAIDSLLRDYATKDTLKNYLTIAGLCDSIKNCEVITNLQNADSLLGARITRDSIQSYKADSILAARITADSILSYKSDSILSARITHDSILSYRADSILSARITHDSILSYKADSVLAARITRDSILSYKADSILAARHIIDSTRITNNTTNINNNTTSITNITNNVNNLHVADSVLNARFTRDSIALSKRLDTMFTHICDSIEQCDAIANLQRADSLLGARIHNDSVLSYKADSALSARLIDTARKIREDFPKVSDKIITIKQGDQPIGSFTLNQESDYELTLPTPPDAQVQSDWNQTTTTEKDYIKNKPNIRDSVNVVMLDSLAAANSAINKAIDTIAGHVIHDSLSNYAIKNCEDVNACVVTAIGNNNSAINQAIDTIARHNIHDTAMVIRTHIRDSIHKVNARLTLDSTKLAGRIHADSVTITNKIRSDSSTVHGALVDSLKHYLDSTQVVRSIHDSIGNGAISIKQGEQTLGTFTTNQKTPQEIEIPTPPVPTYGTLTIKKNNEPVGTFTANQDNSININVPTCDSLANCLLIQDILARLDRLERANDSLAKEIEKLKPTLTLTAPQDTVNVCAGSTNPLTYKATFHNCSSSDYTIAWKVNGKDSSNVTGTTLVFNAETAGDYEVVCVATRSGNVTVTDTVNTTVKVDNVIPSFDTTVHNLAVTLSNITNTATIQWDKDSVPIPFSGTSTDTTYIYSVADTVTITALSARGCTLSKQVVLQPTTPEVTTVSIPTEAITATTAKVNCNLNSDGGIPTTRRGVLFSVSNSNPRLGAAGVDSVMNGAGMGDFTCDLRRLVPCSPYYVCAFAINDLDTVYGEVLHFSTPSFTCGDSLVDIDDNKYATLQLGSQCWMKQNLRTTHYADGTEIPVGTSTDIDLTPFLYEPDSNLTTYGYCYNWAAAMRNPTSSSLNPSGVQGVCPDGWHLPSDPEWTQLMDFVASDPANVCDNNPIYITKALASQEGWCGAGEAGTGCYICSNPSNNNHTGFSVLPAGSWNNGSGDFGPTLKYTAGNAFFTSTTESDNGHIWARIFYTEYLEVRRVGNDKTIGMSVRCVLTKCSSDNTPYAPTVSAVRFVDTVVTTDGTTVSVTLDVAASVSSDGGTPVTERGVCWSNSTSQSPTISDNHTVADGVGNEDFTVTTGNLTPGDTCYVRAYATNNDGATTGYGAVVTFIVPNIPTVMTADATEVTATTAIIGGNVTADNGMHVTARGMCWSDSPNPTIENDTTLNGNGLGSFVGHIKNLASANTYYVRAYATNAIGTGYGEEVAIVTPDWSLHLTSDGADTITLCSATSVTVTYTATPTHGEPGDYTYSWSCSGGTISGSPTSNIATVTYTKSSTFYTSKFDNYTVSCTAHHNTQNFDISKTKSTTIQSGNPVSLAMCSEGLSIYCKEKAASLNPSGIQGNNVGAVSNISWGDGSNTVPTDAERFYHEYASPGIYTVTITSTSDNGSCDVIQTFAMGDAVLRPCTVSNPHTNTSTYTSLTGGLETTDSEGKVTTVADNDNHTYKVVQIGSQCWMAENLRTTKKPNGYNIPLGSSQDASVAYRYDPESGNVDSHGYSYNWTAVMNGESASNANPSGVRRGICPWGWHVPSDAEWTVMENNVNGSAAKLAAGCDWKEDMASYSYYGTQRLTPGDYYYAQRDSSGFGALSTECLDCYSSRASFWTSSTSGNNSYYRRILSNQKSVTRGTFGKEYGCSLRCVRDTVESGSTPSVVALTITSDVADPMICGAGSATVTYTASVAEGGTDVTGNYTYEWSVTDGTSSSNTGTSYTVTYTTGGNHTVSCTATLTGTDDILSETMVTSVAHDPNCCNRINLVSLSGDYVAHDCDTLTGTLGGNYKISIADGATVILRDVTINGTNVANYDWAGINCPGDATIILEGINTVRGFRNDYPGVHVAPNKTLTIKGMGTLYASSSGYGAGIGGGYDISCGNIVIESGTIVATGGNYAAGIGTGVSEEDSTTCGNITIRGGNVTAEGGKYAAGIGTGWSYDIPNKCGNIIISGGTVIARGKEAASGIGTGCAYTYTAANNTCDSISISGGNVTAVGGQYGAGIGTGRSWNATNTCGAITISDGIVTATGDRFGAGVGTGYSNYRCVCGNISITGGEVIATAGHVAAGIGSGLASFQYISNQPQSSCGTISITGGTVEATGGNSGNDNQSVHFKGGAGIGTGDGLSSGNKLFKSNCGAITIGSGVTSVTATKGSEAANSIGRNHSDNPSDCGPVNIADQANVTQN